MDCRTCMELIPLLLVEKLEESESGDVRHHLSLCSECGKVYDRIAVFHDGLRSMHQINANPRLYQRVKSEIAAARISESRIPLPNWAQASVMAIVILFAAGTGNLAGTRLSEIWTTADSEQTSSFFLTDLPSSMDDLIMKIDTNESIR